MSNEQYEQQQQSEYNETVSAALGCLAIGASDEAIWSVIKMALSSKSEIEIEKMLAESGGMLSPRDSLIQRMVATIQRAQYAQVQAPVVVAEQQVQQAPVPEPEQAMEQAEPVQQAPVAMEQVQVEQQVQQQAEPVQLVREFSGYKSPAPASSSVAQLPELNHAELGVEIPPAATDATDATDDNDGFQQPRHQITAARKRAANARRRAVRAAAVAAAAKAEVVAAEAEANEAAKAEASGETTYEAELELKGTGAPDTDTAPVKPMIPGAVPGVTYRSAVLTTAGPNAGKRRNAPTPKRKAGTSAGARVQGRKVQLTAKQKKVNTSTSIRWLLNRKGEKQEYDTFLQGGDTYRYFIDGADGEQVKICSITPVKWTPYGEENSFKWQPVSGCGIVCELLQKSGTREADTWQSYTVELTEDGQFEELVPIEGTDEEVANIVQQTVRDFLAVKRANWLKGQKRRQAQAQAQAV